MHTLILFIKADIGKLTIIAKVLPTLRWDMSSHYYIVIGTKKTTKITIGTINIIEF